MRWKGTGPGFDSQLLLLGQFGRLAILVSDSELEGYRDWRSAFEIGEANIF